MRRLSLSKGGLLTACADTLVLPRTACEGLTTAVPFPVLVQGTCTRQSRA